MNYRQLGATGLKVSEIGMGCEGFSEENFAMTKALLGCRDKFIIQSHICSIWQNGQYKRSMDMKEVQALCALSIRSFHYRKKGSAMSSL